MFSPYNIYPDLPKYAYLCIEKILTESEIIWKLLAYNDADAWAKADLTRDQKITLIYSGEPDETIFRVFMDVGQPDAWTHECCVLRISPYDIYPENRTVGTVSIAFEIYSHYKINHLSNYTTRIDVISQELLRVFNGTVVGGIGRLFFNRMASLNNRAYPSGQIPFKGRTILMSNKEA